MSQTSVGEDATYIALHRLGEGGQYFSVFSPALFTAYALRLRGHNWVPAIPLSAVHKVPSSAAIVMALGSLGFIVCAQACGVGDVKSIHSKRVELEYDVAAARRMRYGLMGSSIGLLVGPLLFWKRAKVSDVMYAGGAIGSGVGVLAYHGRQFWEERFSNHKDKIKAVKRLRDEVDEIMEYDY